MEKENFRSQIDLTDDVQVEFSTTIQLIFLTATTVEKLVWYFSSWCSCSFLKNFTSRLRTKIQRKYEHSELTTTKEWYIAAVTLLSYFWRSFYPCPGWSCFSFTNEKRLVPCRWLNNSSNSLMYSRLRNIWDHMYFHRSHDQTTLHNFRRTQFAFGF